MPALVAACSAATSPAAQSNAAREAGTLSITPAISDLQPEPGEEDAREPRGRDRAVPLRQRPGDQRNDDEADEALRLQ